MSLRVRACLGTKGNTLFNPCRPRTRFKSCRWSATKTSSMRFAKRLPSTTTTGSRRPMDTGPRRTGTKSWATHGRVSFLQSSTRRAFTLTEQSCHRALVHKSSRLGRYSQPSGPWSETSGSFGASPRVGRSTEFAFEVVTTSGPLMPSSWELRHRQRRGPVE